MCCKFQGWTQRLVRISACFYPFQRMLPVHRTYALPGQVQVQKRTKFTIDEQNILFSRRTGWKNQVSAFNTKMMNCMNPLQKYECLMNLREKNRELYYHYICEYAGEVMSLMKTVDGLSNKMTGKGANVPKRKAIQHIRDSTESLQLPQNSNNLLPRLLNVSDAMDFLRRMIKTKEGGHAQNAYVERAVETGVELGKSSKEESVPESNRPKKLIRREPKKFIMYVRNGNKPKK